MWSASSSSSTLCAPETPYLRREAVAGEHVGHLAGRQARLERKPLYDVGLADRLPLGEVGAEEALLHLVLDAVLGAQPDQTVRIEASVLRLKLVDM